MSRSVNKRPIAVIDCETDPFKHGRKLAPFVWGLFDGVEFVYFWGHDCTRRLIEYLSDKKFLIYAHNGGKFDYFFLLEYLEKTDIKMINGRIAQAKIGENIIRDSYNILPIPLGAYKKDDIEYWKMEKEFRQEHSEEIISYLKGDCVYLYELVTAFCERFGRKLTVAGAAMTELNKTLPGGIERINIFTDSKYRPYYYGGRCQAFKIGEISEPVKVFDINSAYPYAMVHQHPDPSFNSWNVTSGRLPDKGPYFATIKAVAKGCLPFRVEKTKELIFPTDDVIREYKVTGWEIDAGLETGTLKIHEVLEVRIPDKTRDFSEFVHKHYKEKADAKEAGDSVAEIFAKLMLNSSYGKFGQSSLDFEDWQLVAPGDWPVYTDHELEIIREKNLSFTEVDNSIVIDERGKLEQKIYLWEFETELEDGTQLYRRPSPDANGFYNVAVAASITGFVRAYLWRAICASEGVIYCDTDSIVCKKFNGETGPELGQWKYEGTAKAGFVAGKKLYALWAKDGDPDFSFTDQREAKRGGWKMATKGARLTPFEIAHITKNDAKVKWINEAPTFSLTRGVNYLSREIKLKNSEKSC